MQKEKIEEIAKMLSDITYSEWLKIKWVAEKHYENKIADIKITDTEIEMICKDLEIEFFKENRISFL